MKTITAILCVTILLAPEGSAAGPQVRQWRRKVFSPESAARTAAAAGINQARNVPHEWGGGAGGFAKRAASSFGQHVVGATIEVGVGAIHHEDLSFHRSNLQGTWPRMKYAVKSTFIVPRTNGPGHTVAAGRIAGAFGGGLVSRAWQPASTASVGAGIASGGVALGADVGIHVAHEFWPQHKPRPR